MSDDAEWVGVDNEFGVVSIDPASPRATTARPWWVTPLIPRPGANTPWLPRNPNGTPRESPEREDPSEHQGLDSEQIGLISGLLGAVLGLALVALVVYMVVLKKRLKKAEKSKNASDYSIRVEDVATLSTALDDSSQLYVNTSDLHKLVASVQASKNNSKKANSSLSTNVHDRPIYPAPNQLPLPARSNEDARRPKIGDAVVKKLHRISDRLSGINFTGISLKLPNLPINARTTVKPVRNDTIDSSMPDIVQVGMPDMGDDDDIWSEDSFDSCSVGTGNDFDSRMGSARKSRRSEKSSKVCSSKKAISHPTVPPPPVPDTSKPGASKIDSPAALSAVRKAPPPPITRKKSLEGIDDIYENSVLHASIFVGEDTTSGINIRPSTTKFGNQKPRTPELPKSETWLNPKKPVPPVAPKPSAKPMTRPKLNIGLTVPKNAPDSAVVTPDTAITILPCTPDIKRISENNARLRDGNDYISIPLENGQSSKEDVIESSGLSVSARRALLERKVGFGKI